MRTLKFRAWDKYNLKMVQPFSMSHLLNNYNCEYALTQREDITQFNFSNGKEVEILQFTGLIDKNGKEIYEGDIVISRLGKERMPDKVSVIEYRDGYAYFGMHFDRDTDYDFWHDIHTKDSGGYDFQIIGNIYENFNLLSK